MARYFILYVGAERDFACKALLLREVMQVAPAPMLFAHTPATDNIHRQPHMLLWANARNNQCMARHYNLYNLSNQHLYGVY